MPMIRRRGAVTATTALERRAVASPPALRFARSAGGLTTATAMPRAMTAAAARVNVLDRTATKRLARLRQPWQSEGWVFRRNLGELRYATAYLGNSVARIRFFPGVYVPGEDEPVAVEDGFGAAGIPEQLAIDARDSMERLAAGGPIALGAMQKSLTESFEIAGECYLIGTVDPIERTEEWQIRSTSETVITNDGRFGIRSAPSSGSVGDEIEWVEAETTFVTRLWWPDPEWRVLADSPVRAVLDILEELLLLGKDVRATARSRLANNGILGIPSELEVIPASAIDIDPDADPFLSEFLATAAAALTDEGSAASVVPILVKGPGEHIDKIKHIPIERKVHEGNTAQRTELITRLATGLDLPAEVLTGKADLNHWTAWQVDDDSFRHHIEPIVVVECDALTVGHLWTDLEARGWAPDLVRKVVVWYDPTALVTHPDRSDDAFKAWDRMAISDKALRGYLGFPDTDEPTEQEILTRMATHLRTLDPAIQAAILAKIDPTLRGVVPTKSDIGPSETNPTGAPPPAAPAEGPPPADGAPTPAPAPAPAAPAASVDAVTAAADPAIPDHTLAASRRLVDLDRSLRTRLHTAANLALHRALERAGARVVSKARTSSSQPIRDAVREVPTWLVPATLGPAVVAALGLTETQIIDAAFAELHDQWEKWVATGQQQALRDAASIAGLDVSVAYAQVAGKFADDREAGWRVLRGAMEDRARQLLAERPLADAEVVVEVDNLLSVNAVRAALAVAGGFGGSVTSAGLGDNLAPMSSAEPMGGIGTGTTVTGLLTDSGGNVAAYQWIHGYSDNPFEPHLALDGAIFSEFDDSALSIPPDAGWSAGYWTPGDHKGCSCDFMPMWLPPGSA